MKVLYFQIIFIEVKSIIKIITIELKRVKRILLPLDVLDNLTRNKSRTINI